MNHFDSLKIEYADAGYYLWPSLFSEEELVRLNDEIAGAGGFQPMAVVKEDGGGAVRSVYGGYESSALLQRLLADDRLVGPVMQLLSDEVYVYQFKVNMKHPFGGDVWPWHQDYAFWKNLDHMPRPDAVTAALLLDDATEFNAPMFCVAGSHKAGLYRFERGDDSSAEQVAKHDLDVSSRLRYTLAPEVVTSLVAGAGIFSARAPRGSVLFFHPNLVHASSVNISPHSRRQVLITYNSIRNALPHKSARPAYLVNSAVASIVPRRGALTRTDDAALSG